MPDGDKARGLESQLARMQQEQWERKRESILADPDAELNRRDFQIDQKISKIEAAADDLARQQAEIKTLVADLSKKVEPQPSNILYVVIFLVVVSVVGLLVWADLANKPDVSIDFDVGEIIGGILVGIASMIAGLAYARRQQLIR